MSFWLTQYLKSRGDNFGRVTPLIYRSAELPARQLRGLRDGFGIEAMLNLRHDLPDEEIGEIKVAGLELFWQPMRDDREPLPGEIVGVLRVLRQSRVKLVCCKGGRHRTGLVVAVYRVVEQGWTKADAWSEALQFGYYDAFGHAPLRRWFENEFKPDDYR